MSLLQAKRNVYAVLCAGLLFSIADASAETFRVKRTAFLTVAEVDAENESVPQEKVNVGINDCLCVMLPKELTFIQGIELTVKIPAAIMRCPNTIIYSLYENIVPVPSNSTIDYTGNELFTGLYPGQVSTVIQIPLVKGNSIKKTPYADKTLIPEHSRNFIFIRNQLAMKGIPNDVYSAQFEVSAKPILINKGRLVLKTNPSKPENLSVTVDDKIIELDQNGSCLLTPGVHNITLNADSVRNETRSCIIELAKNTVLEIDLKSTAPTVFITMPQGTQLFVNEQPSQPKNGFLTLPPGEHTLKFSLGGYEVVKQVAIQEGRTYSINITVDADFTEN